MVGNEETEGNVLKILERLGQQPAVAFMEGRVSAEILNIASRAALPSSVDAFGNLWVTYDGPRSDDADLPDIAFIAHMDHPGFEVVEQIEKGYVARALGGVPPSSLLPGAELSIVAGESEPVPAVVLDRHGAVEERSVILDLKEARSLDLPALAVFDLPSFLPADGRVHMRAADDLAGCATILAAISRMAIGAGQANGDVGRVHGIFTRAEEVGLVGSRLLAEAGDLPKDCIVVSLEASRSLPGALMGDGPVIRVGDAAFTFDAGAESVLNRAREQLQEQLPGFRCQRQLMSGGTCEASAFIYHGYRATGIALPLGNYHNATEDGGIGAEYIDTGDLEQAVDLVAEAARSVANRHLSRSWQRIAVLPDQLRQRLSP